MDYKIIDIEGVGDVYAEKLQAAGIKKVSELLEKCAAPKGRKELAEATGISEKLILKWTNHADLFRISRYREEIVQMDGFGQKSFEKLTGALDKARHTS